MWEPSKSAPPLLLPFCLSFPRISFQRFPRKLNIAQEFARYLHFDPTSLSKIKSNRREVGAQTDKLVCLLVVNMDQKLAEAASKLMELIPNIQDACTSPGREILSDPSSLALVHA